MTTIDEQWEALRAPFTGDDVGKLPKGKGRGEEGKCSICGGWHYKEGIFHVDYVGHAVITARLNEVDPSWVLTPGPIQRDDDRDMAFMVASLTVLGVTKWETGCASTRLDEWPKLLFSDTLTRCAMRFGVATYLWKKSGPGGEPMVDRGPRSAGGGSSGPRNGSSGSGAPSRTSPSVGVLWEDLKLAVGRISTDGGRADWSDWKDERGWAHVWANDGNKITEKRRELIEEALRFVREILNVEATAAGEEPWDPLEGADPAETQGASFVRDPEGDASGSVHPSYDDEGENAYG